MCGSTALQGGTQTHHQVMPVRLAQQLQAPAAEAHRGRAVSGSVGSLTVRRHHLVVDASEQQRASHLVPRVLVGIAPHAQRERELAAACVTAVTLIP
ncbi:MAG TPA: hypothetical protein VGF95_10960 [Solirubrobacteraceae bacterium]